MSFSVRLPRTPLAVAGVLVIAVFTMGTVGYRVLERASWWDSFFMTVITVTTLSGLGVLLFVVTELSRSVVEGELRQFLGQVRRSRMIERMSNHEIVCGYGRMGRAVVEELPRAGREVVVVEVSVDRVRELQESRIPVVSGDGTSEASLLAANVARAKGLVSTLADDAHNVYTVLTARSLNPELFIVARATEGGAERRILRAGADRVVNPYHLGGTRIAHLVVKPAIINFFDASLDGADLQLDQTSIGKDSPLIDRTLAEADVRKKCGLAVVAAQRKKDVVPSPPPDFRVQADDVLVVFGHREQIAMFEKKCGQLTDSGH